jgi:hypothetical protein
MLLCTWYDGLDRGKVRREPPPEAAENFRTPSRADARHDCLCDPTDHTSYAVVGSDFVTAFILAVAAGACHAAMVAL